MVVITEDMLPSLRGFLKDMLLGAGSMNFDNLDSDAWERNGLPKYNLVHLAWNPTKRGAQAILGIEGRYTNSDPDPAFTNLFVILFAEICGIDLTNL